MQGKIKSVAASWGSGIITLDVIDPDGKTVAVHGDNGPTVRALDSLFGCIGPGHSINVNAIIGQEIEYSLTDWGTIESLSSL